MFLKLTLASRIINIVTKIESSGFRTEDFLNLLKYYLFGNKISDIPPGPKTNAKRDTKNSKNPF